MARSESDAAARAAEIDATQCPLCGRSNACARAADPAATRCWCGPQHFPRTLLAELPARAIGRACICLQCLAGHRSQAGD